MSDMTNPRWISQADQACVYVYVCVSVFAPPFVRVGVGAWVETWPRFHVFIGPCYAARFGDHGGEKGRDEDTASAGGGGRLKHKGDRNGTNKEETKETETSERNLEELRVNIYVPSLGRQW